MDKSAIDPVIDAKLQRKQKERLESFARLKSEHILDENATNIVQLPVDELLQRLKSRQVSARVVLNAFTAKALEVNEKFNCITEFIPQAFEWASALDAISPGSNTTGPLHGLPVAIKEDHDVEGMDTTMGFAKKLYKPVKESAVLVKILLKLGAVPFAKTNIPQSIFSSGSENPIFGTTLNAHNANLAPGGSSSGSGSLVAAGGAPIATGSDLGGSLRIPSSFHGIATLRGTINRLSEKGVLQCLPKGIEQRGVPGIMAPDAKTLALVWKAITEDNIQNQFDPVAVPLPWNENVFSSKKRLKIGYITSLPLFPATEDTRKTVLAAKNALESMGHETIDFEFPDGARYMKLTLDLLVSDHGEYLEQMFAGERVACCVADFVESLRNPKLSGDASHSNKAPARDKVFSRCGVDVKTAGDLWDLVNEKRVIAEDILDRMQRDGIDLILSPAYPFPAVKLHEGYGLGMLAIVYTVLWNFVDFPAGVVRFGKESQASIDSYDDEGDAVLSRVKEALAESAGMPINVQIIGKPFKEEMVLRALVELENYRKASSD